MAKFEIKNQVKSSSPEDSLNVLTSSISIGEALANLKKEQKFFKEISAEDKLYPQMASSLVAIPSDASARSPEQSEALAAVVNFGVTAKDFRKIIATPRNLPEADLETKRAATILSLKKSVEEVSNSVKKVTYGYGPTTKLASSLEKIYLAHSSNFINQIIDESSAQTLASSKLSS